MDTRNCKYRKACCGNHIYCALRDMLTPARLCVSCDRTLRFDVSCKATGIGDAICGLYTISGLRRKFPAARIRYYTHQAQWLCRSAYELAPFDQAPAAACEISQNYGEQLEQMAERKSWYSRHVNCEPSAPEMDLPEVAKENFVLLAPFSHWPTREWPLGYWLYLEALLKERLDVPCFVIGCESNREALQKFQGRFGHGLAPDDLIRLMLAARLVIACDSGPAHLAGLLGVPTIAIIAQISGDALFSHTAVKTISPATPCAPCFFQHARGYRSGCDHICHALATITPRHVFAVAKQILANAEAEAKRRSKTPKQNAEAPQAMEIAG